MINILLTFDYELPLGGIKKSYEESLFVPTDQLLALVQKLNVPIVLFADILSYSRFKQKNIFAYSEPFKNQLQKAIQMGHDVQLHLHPHWLQTKIESDSFIPDTRFSLGNYDDQEIKDFISLGVNTLTALGQEVDSQYQCLAYRAGGYNLQSKAEIVLPLLLEQGIKFDSSISRGYYFYSDLSKVDYRKLPHKGNWFLDLKGDFSKEQFHGIMEVPIASKSKSFFEMPTSLKLKRLNYRAVDRGKMIHKPISIPFQEKLGMLRSSRMLTVDNYTYSSSYLNAILEDHLQKYYQNSDISLALIAHPKSMGNYSMELLANFIQDTKQKYGSSVRFTTFKQLAHEIKD